MNLSYILSIIPEFEQAKPWLKHWLPIIEKRIRSQNPQESSLLKVFSTSVGVHTWRTMKYLTEYAFVQCKDSQKIFTHVVSRMKNNDSDYIIDEMLAELRAIPALMVFGITDIQHYKESNIDFTGKLADEQIVIEVSYIRGPSFKTQRCVNSDSPMKYYELKPQKLINRLKSKYDEEEIQMQKHCNLISAIKIIFLVTDLEEVYQPWLEDQSYNGKHPIQAFVDSCEIGTILLGPGSIPYISEKLASKLKAFDRNVYIKIAKGIYA